MARNGRPLLLVPFQWAINRGAEQGAQLLQSGSVTGRQLGAGHKGQRAQLLQSGSVSVMYIL